MKKHTCIKFIGLLATAATGLTLASCGGGGSGGGNDSSADSSTQSPGYTSENMIGLRSVTNISMIMGHELQGVKSVKFTTDSTVRAYVNKTYHYGEYRFTRTSDTDATLEYSIPSLKLYDVRIQMTFSSELKARANSVTAKLAMIESDFGATNVDFYKYLSL